MHALTIGITVGATFSLLLFFFGHHLLGAMGGRDRVLEEAMKFSSVWFGGVTLIWLMNTLVAILRGTGNMTLPSAIVFSSALCQIVVGGTFSLGLAGMPQLGIRGIAIGQLTGFSSSVVIMGWYVLSGRSRISLRVPNFRYQARNVHRHSEGRRARLLLSRAIGADRRLLHLDARAFRHRGAGRLRHRRAARFMLTSIAFATGVASVPMVGMAVGAGRIAARGGSPGAALCSPHSASAFSAC